MASVKNRACRDRLEKYKAEVKTKDRLLASINKISGLLNRPIQGEKILHQLVKEMKRVFDLKRVVIFLINRKENLLEVSTLSGSARKKWSRRSRIPSI